MDNVRTSSLVDSNVEQVNNDQIAAPTWLIVVILICAMVVLKSFIYIKDPKRHGK